MPLRPKQRTWRKGPRDEQDERLEGRLVSTQPDLSVGQMLRSDKAKQQLADVIGLDAGLLVN